MNTLAPPVCNICGATKAWVPPGVKKSTIGAPGTPYDGFWGCPNFKDQQHKAPKGKPAGYPRQEEPPPVGEYASPPPQRAYAAPGTANGPAPGPDATARSIMAQTCIRGACDAFAAIDGLGATNQEQHAWIIALARRLYLEVALPATAGTLGDPDADIGF